MIRIARATLAIALLVSVGLVTASCAPAAGPLGTPASPRVTPAAASGEPAPSDVAPGTPSPSPSPSPSPTQPPSLAPTGSPSQSSAAASATPTSRPSPTPAPTPVATTIVRAYFMLGSFTDNPGLAPVLRTVPETKTVANAAMTALLEGPKGAELAASPAMYTSIPDGTRLLDLSIADGVAMVNLSAEYKGAIASFQGGTANAQVIFTLTQFSTVKLVRIEVEGQSQGGALGRSDYQLVGLLPAIFVDRPAWGAAAGNPARISGLANVFEATFRAEIRDAQGGILVDKQVMASCGTGCWGTFKADLPYSVSKAQYGTLRVYDLSAKDGTPENVTEYPVWLTPAP